MKTEEEVKQRLRKCRRRLYDSNLDEEAIKRLGLIELILEWVLGDSKEI